MQAAYKIYAYKNNKRFLYNSYDMNGYLRAVDDMRHQSMKNNEIILRLFEMDSTGPSVWLIEFVRTNENIHRKYNLEFFIGTIPSLHENDNVPLLLKERVPITQNIANYIENCLNIL